jgi:nucleotide-binding universal stress UspA family protein
VESGSVVEAIVEYATEEKAQLIVMGTRGMTGFKKMLLGSVSNGVVNHAPCAVLVVR